MKRQVLFCDFSCTDTAGVYRCARCGFRTAPTRFPPEKVHKQCQRVDLASPVGCRCRGLGDVVVMFFEWLSGKMPHKCVEVRKLLLQQSSRYSRFIERVFAFLPGSALDPQSSGCGCARRQQSLNQRYPARWLCRRLCPPPVPLLDGTRKKRALWTFPHGLGDAVQFTAVLRHMRHLHPEVTIDVRSKVGAHTCFRGLADRTFAYNQPGGDQPIMANYDDVRTVYFYEPEETYSDSPATKVERCLKEMLGVRPIPELNYYSVHPYDHERALATEYLESICGRSSADDADFAEKKSASSSSAQSASSADRFPVVLIHYQGNSARAWKNTEEDIAADVIHAVMEAGRVPVVLDFETPYRSKWAGQIEGLQLLGATHPMWGGTGTGDAAQLAALIERVELVVGIDSGPEHVAAATETPTIVVWKKLHPVNYFGLADNVTHVVAPDQHRRIRGDQATGDRFFRDHYRYHFCYRHLRYELPELVREELTRCRVA